MNEKLIFLFIIYKTKNPIFKYYAKNGFNCPF